jgi:hypothetical protein
MIPTEKTLVPRTVDTIHALHQGRVDTDMLLACQECTAKARVLHWGLTFGDVFNRGGFDAVIGNPPWERIKLQEREYFAKYDTDIAEAPTAAAREALIEKLKGSDVDISKRAIYNSYIDAKRTSEASSTFMRLDGSKGGRFPRAGRGDVNTYALFSELFTQLLSKRGRAGIIVPTGIATEATTAPFFAALVTEKKLARLLDFENKEGIFPAVHRSYRFSVLSIAHRVDLPRYAFSLTSVTQINDSERLFMLTAEDIERINPNTKTAPVFRTKADADIVAGIYKRNAVLIDETGASSDAAWRVRSHTRLWHIAEDSNWFRTAEQLAKTEYEPAGNKWIAKQENGSGNTIYVPVYEAKMMHQFDHRWFSYGKEIASSDPVSAKQNVKAEPMPRFWVPQLEVDARLNAQKWRRGWLMGWRNITRSTDERTAIFSILPRVAVVDTCPLLFVEDDARMCAALYANMNSLVFDFVTRDKGRRYASHI